MCSLAAVRAHRWCRARRLGALMTVRTALLQGSAHRKRAQPALLPICVSSVAAAEQRLTQVCVLGEVPSVWRYYCNVPDELSAMRTPGAAAIADRHLRCDPCHDMRVSPLVTNQ